MQATYFIDTFLLQKIYPGCKRSAQRRYNLLKETYGKKPHQSISLFELAHYEDTDIYKLAAWLNIKLPQHLPQFIAPENMAKAG